MVVRATFAKALKRLLYRKENCGGFLLAALEII
jgi:hypothetical protein